MLASFMRFYKSFESMLLSLSIFACFLAAYSCFMSASWCAFISMAWFIKSSLSSALKPSFCSILRILSSIYGRSMTCLLPGVPWWAYLCSKARCTLFAYSAIVPDAWAALGSAPLTRSRCDHSNCLKSSANFSLASGSSSSGRTSASFLAGELRLAFLSSLY